MMRPSVFRVMVKDLIDFLLVASLTCAFTWGIYTVVPTFKPVELSLYFFEQFAEVFFMNQKLLVWFIGLSVGVSIIYFLLCSMLHETTLGGRVARLAIVDKKKMTPLKPYQAFLMGVGSVVGVFFILIGPLWAWWLDSEHRGFSEKLAGTTVVRKTALTKAAQ